MARPPAAPTLGGVNAVSLQHPVAGPAPDGGAGSVVRSILGRAVVLAVGGAAVGLLWAAIAPAVRGASEGIEREVGGDLAFAGLAVLAGLVVAVAGLVRPGRRPATGALVNLVGSGAASGVAWGVGRAVGAPVIAATGVLVLWPLTTALVTALVSLLLVLLRPDGAPGA